jgi:probable O-glycosylation ligase (exosortase A-associated)
MLGLVFTYVMTYGGAIASIINPLIGVLVYISFAILRPEELWRWSVPPGNYSLIIGIALLAGWVLKGFGRWDLGRGKTIIQILFLYYGWIILSAVQAPSQAIAWEFVEHYAKIILPILVGITTITTVRQLKVLAWIILLSQAFPAYELNMSYFAGYNRLAEEGAGGVDNNGYAISLNSCIGLGCFLTWHSERWWQKAVAATCAAFMVHAVLLSFSRGGMIGLIVMATASFAVMPKGPKEYMAFALALTVGLGLAGKEVRERFGTSFAEENGQREASAESRLVLWAACWDTMTQYPVFGVGPDHMPLRMDQYGFNQGKEAHSLWLQTGAELGFPGMFLLSAFYAICIIRLWPIARGTTIVADPWLVYLARAVVGSLCGFVVSAQFVTVEFLEPPYYVVLVGVGILKLDTLNRSTGRAPG